MAIDLPTEERWWCERCKAYVCTEDDISRELRVVVIPEDEDARNKYLFDHWDLCVGNSYGRVDRHGPVRVHRNYFDRKAGWGGGRLHSWCGPVEQVTVGTQELWLEWIGAAP